MKVAVLGSGSRGNAIAFSSDGHTILLDAGFSLKDLTRRATDAGVDLDAVTAVLLTHEHGDHARGAAPVARRAGCPLYGSAGTLAALAPHLGGVATVALAQYRAERIGPFLVTAARTSHDAAEPLAFAVADAVSGVRAAVAYDVGVPTAGLRYLLQEAACLVLEANHDDVLLRTSAYPASVRARIAGPGGHLSNRAAADLLAELWHPGLSTVVLAHLSDRCNREDLARESAHAVLDAAGFRGRLLVAAQDEPLEPFDLRPPQLALELPR